VSCETVRYVTVTRFVWGNENDVDSRNLCCGKISVGSNTSVTGKQNNNLLWRSICGFECFCDQKTKAKFVVEKYLWGRMPLWPVKETKTCQALLKRSLHSTWSTYHNTTHILMSSRFIHFSILKFLCLADWLQTLVTTSIYCDNIRDGQTETARNRTIQEQYSVSGFLFPAVTVLNREIILEMV